MKTFQYFQPEYVSKFQCDGSKCDARCCKGWTITIDAATYKRYSRIKPKDRAKEITSHMKFDSERGMQVVTLKEDASCPFLTKDKLCGIQLEYGEDYLSQTCVTYPRRTHRIGNFFELSLTLTCPVAAELILFNPEPMRFEFVEVPDKLHSKHGRIQITSFTINKVNAEILREIQITMITVLQERRFTLDQRLILLGLFLDSFQEYQTVKQDKEILWQMIKGYRSEEFLSGDAIQLIQHFAFDAQSFITFMIKFISHTLDCLKTEEGLRFLGAFEETLGINPDENHQFNLVEIAANFERLANARADFLVKNSSFLENYLVNELFYSFYPWKFKESFTKNYAVFLISYKIFELMTFTTVHSGLSSKDDLLAMVNWFMMRTDHNPDLYKRFLELLEGVDDTYLLMVTLL